MKALAGCLCALLIALQWRLWFGEGSLQQVSRLREEARAARAEVVRLRGRDRALAAEVTDLKSGLDAIEERARSELGMIDENETFFRFVREPGDEVGPAPRSGDRAAPADLPDGDGDVEVIDAAAARAARSDADANADEGITVGTSGEIRRIRRVE